jgi:16S rRNA (cytosine1402-N4)-methyltransferase
MDRPGLGENQDLWHLPVMVREVQEFLILESTRVIVDCTVGTGGHAAAMLEAASPGAVLYGIDMDKEALEMATSRLSRFGRRVFLMKTNFRYLARDLPPQTVGKVDALLLDCGISRLQIVRASRGFSFDRDGELDMRFDRSSQRTAASVLAKLSAAELARLLLQFGERSRAKRIAQAVLKRRDRGQLATTGDLADAVKTVSKTRVAKSLARVFLAIRSQVNLELENLAEVLDCLPQVLSKGGRAGVISYHSAEDGITKRYFRKLSGKCVCPPGRLVCDCGRASFLRILTPKPVLPSGPEVRRNPGARSARLRVVEKM